MAGRALAWLQAPVGGARPLAGLVASLAQRFGDPAPLTSLAAGVARSSGLLQADVESRPMPECALSVPQPIVLALADPPVLSWPGLRVGMADPPPLPPSLRKAAASRARALSRRAAAGIVVRSGHPREAKAVAAEICAHLGARALFLEGDPPEGSALAVARRGDSRDVRRARSGRAAPAEGHSRLERAAAGRRGTRRQLRARGRSPSRLARAGAGAGGAHRAVAGGHGRRRTRRTSRPRASACERPHRRARPRRALPGGARAAATRIGPAASPRRRAAATGGDLGTLAELLPETDSRRRAGAAGGDQVASWSR